MQNEDEELRGLEEKLGGLKPRELDESYLEQLIGSLKTNRDEGESFQPSQSTQQRDEAYPSNVLWMRFAPIAAAAGVVLLGTFFLHYESRMEGIQAQVNKVDEFPVSELAVSAPELAALPVPRLGVGEEYNSSSLGISDPSLLPVSGQNYLQPLDESMGGLYGNGVAATATLHFAEAYDWQEDKKAAKAEVKGAK